MSINPLDTRGWRRLAKTLLLSGLTRAFDTDEGRAIAVRSLAGLLRELPDLPGPEARPPYQDLGWAEPPRSYASTVFITARFRTGSTLLWNLFRHMPECVAYYEPLNERRWFDPARRGAKLDSTHRGVDDYWREYDGLSELTAVFRDEWASRSLYLESRAWAPDLRSYIERLIDHAAPRRAVLQFNRADFRLPWLRAQFPDAKIVHLFRHPRDQWCSSLVDPTRAARAITMAEFAPFDYFYLTAWATDLGRHFPFLLDPTRHPYSIFYLLWRLSYAVGSAHADHSLAYEALIASPESEIARLTGALSLEADVRVLAALVGSPPPTRRAEYAPDEWFSAQEAECDVILAEFVRGQ